MITEMSFGFSISDIISIANLARQTYNSCVEACGEHARITAEIRTLRSVLRRVRKAAGTSRSPLNCDSDGGELEEIIKDCTKVLNQINKILQKHSSLSSKRPNLWDRFSFGTEDFGDLRRQISAHHKSITLLLLSTTYEGVWKVDTKLDTVIDEFPRIQQAIDKLVAENKSSASSVWTAYSDDNLETWRQIRRDLINDGIPAETLRKYRKEIKSYVRLLQLGSSLHLPRPDDSLNGTGMPDIIPAVVLPPVPEPSSLDHHFHDETPEPDLSDDAQSIASIQAGHESHSEVGTEEETDSEDSSASGKMRRQIRAAQAYIKRSKERANQRRLPHNEGSLEPDKPGAQELPS